MASSNSARTKPLLWYGRNISFTVIISHNLRFMMIKEEWRLMSFSFKAWFIRRKEMFSSPCMSLSFLHSLFSFHHFVCNGFSQNHWWMTGLSRSIFSPFCVGRRACCTHSFTITLILGIPRSSPSLFLSFFTSFSSIPPFFYFQLTSPLQVCVIYGRVCAAIEDTPLQVSLLPPLPLLPCTPVANHCTPRVSWGN